MIPRAIMERDKDSIRAFRRQEKLGSVNRCASGHIWRGLAGWQMCSRRSGPDWGMSWVAALAGLFDQRLAMPAEVGQVGQRGGQPKVWPSQAICYMTWAPPSAALERHVHLLSFRVQRSSQPCD